MLKIDYVFSQAILDVVDPKQGVIGKFDEASKQFVIDTGLLKATFEFKEAENKWSLTVPDLNGEWAVLIPAAAVNQKQRRSVL